MLAVELPDCVPGWCSVSTLAVAKWDLPEKSPQVKMAQVPAQELD